MNNVFLTYSQLVQKSEKHVQEMVTQRLKNFNANKQLNRLGKALSYHKRFMVLLSENNIPRLNQLVAVALRNRRSITYITEKVMQAIDGVYLARPSEDDKDLAYLILKLGGPSLLTICYKANKLPSVSTAHRVAKTMKGLKCSINMSVEDCFKANVDLSHATHAASLKADETALTPRLRYDSKTDNVLGTCYQHSKDQVLQFNTYEEAQTIKDSITEGAIHIPKDLLVVGLNSMCDNAPLQIILAWPSCEKDDVTGTIELYGKISKSYNSATGKKVMNFGSDGDPTRRLSFNELTKFELQASTPLGKMVSEMEFLDTNVGFFDETVSFDPKHLVKRMWTNVINEAFVAQGVPLMKNDIRSLLSINEDYIGHKLDSLIYPKDKQNVPAATTFLILFKNAVQSGKELPYRLIPIKDTLNAFSHVIEGILSFYCYPDLGIDEQIRAFSKASFMLLILKRENPDIVPNVLYHDLQATFKDAIYCSSKMKLLCPEEPLYLVKNGTDSLERYFGNLRIMNKNNSIDYLEFLNSSSATRGLGFMTTEKHPDWAKTSGGRMQRRLCLDYSNPRVWNSEKLKLEAVDVVANYKAGMHEGVSKLIVFGYNVNLHKLKEEEVTLMRPHGELIGVSCTSLDVDAILDEADIVPADDEDVLLADYIHSRTIDLDGKQVYKATIVKELVPTAVLSKDRLTRDTGQEIRAKEIRAKRYGPRSTRKLK